MVGRQPHSGVAFITGEIPGTHLQCTSFRRGNHGKKSPVTPLGIDPGTVRLVTQCLNHYATPGLSKNTISLKSKINGHLKELGVDVKITIKEMGCENVH